MFEFLECEIIIFSIIVSGFIIKKLKVFHRVFWRIFRGFGKGKSLYWFIFCFYGAGFIFSTFFTL